MIYDVIREHITWREATIPLGQVTINDLCSKLEILPSDPRCDISNSPVYGPDFFRDIYGTFTPDNQPWATYNNVEEIIGSYKYKCEPSVKQADGLEYYVCAYDFASDRVFPIVVFYYVNGNIMRLIADVSD